MAVVPPPRIATRPRFRQESTALARLLALSVAVGIGIGMYFGLTSGNHRVLFAARFPDSGLVTNEYAYYSHGASDAVRSTDWVATSGTLFARDGNGWTGRPDGRAPDPTSSVSTDSAVFRLRSRRRDFGNVAVSFRLRLMRLVTTSRTPSQAYDGVHVWLRYQSPNWLYFASVSRRDGRIVIGRKLPTKRGGVYADLIRVSGHPFQRERWESVRVTIETRGRSVLIGLTVDGRLLARTVDDGSRGPNILRPGRVGIRGDNAEFEFQGFSVTAL